MLRGALALAALWLVAAAVLVALGARAAQRGAEEVRALDLALDVGDLLDGDVDHRVGRAGDEFALADRVLGNPLLAPARHLPVLGRQLRSAGALAGTGSAVARRSSAALDVLRAEVDEGAPTGAGRVSALRRLRAELRSVDEVLDAVDLGPREALVGPLRDARAEVEAKLADARGRLGDVLTTTDAVHRVLDGPSRYLVLAANNAEMRIGSAMVLSVGTVDVNGGRITVAQEFEPAGDLMLARPIDLPPDLRALWGWSTLGADYRSLALSARFPETADIAARMWSSLGRGDVDGVLLIDVEGIASLLRIAGPVEVDGQRIDADAAAPFLLREQYEEQALYDDAANAARRDRLRVLATAALEGLGDADIDLRALLDQLRSARDGRHLLAWARDPHVQAGWQAMDVHGELGPRSMLVGLANFDHSKLDPYVRVRADVQARRAGGDAVVSVALEVAYEPPSDLPGYVTGPDGGTAYRGLVAAHLPERASEVALDGFDGRAAIGRDGRTVVIAARVDVDRGATRTGELQFRIPASELARASLLPSARIPAVTWRLGGDERFDDSASEWPPHVP